MSISKDQWPAIQKELESGLARVEFRLGENKIAIRRVNISENRTALAVYIDGVMNFSEGWPSSEQFRPLTEQIWRKRSKSIYSPAKVKKMEKDIGKRRVRKICPDIDKKLEWYDPTFNTAASLVRQFKKLEGLALIECGYQSMDELLKDAS